MTIDDFPGYFRELHGVEPFKWQARLAGRVCQHGWGSGQDAANELDGRTDLIALPTSAGKTAVIDIALFHLALEAELPARDRRAARRIFFVIDRRIVVDEAHVRSRRIASQLRTATAGILKEVADRLRRVAGDPGADPLVVAIMRGGMYRNDGWATSPVQPAVCVSTVDQVGSRLLFRGYGLSEYQRPIYAGLVGGDSLIILDEAHISNPFVETLEAVRRYSSEDWAEIRSAVGRPLQRVRMTATPLTGRAPFHLKADDRQDEILSARLTASKRARLVLVDTKLITQAMSRAEKLAAESENGTAFLEDVITHAKSLARLDSTNTGDAAVPPPAQVIGLVVNRVATARRVFDQLKTLRTKDGEAVCYVILLTGRIRPYDRDQLLHYSEVNGQATGWLRLIRANRSPEDRLDKPLFVVATQTVEVGADLSFDALVTEVASLDALRQRFGRLDRLGQRKRTDAVIVAREDHVARTTHDPVYGTALHATWKQLSEWATAQGRRANRVYMIDFGIDALQPKIDELMRRDGEAFVALCAPAKHAPVLLPAHVDTLCQTSPTPAADPDVALFLHGPKASPPDVQIVWRGDLPDILDPSYLEDYVATINLVPPTSLEALAVPIYDFRSWFANRSLGETLVDVEGAEHEEEAERRTPDLTGLVLRWRGPEDKLTQLIPFSQVHPGDTVIVPASYGGCDLFGWNPAVTARVRDVADACARLARWRPVLRLQESVMNSWHWPGAGDEGGHFPAFVEKIVSMFKSTTGADEARPDFDPILRLLRDDARAPHWARLAAEELHGFGNRRSPLCYPDDSGWLLERKRRLTRDQIGPLNETEAPRGQTTEDDTSWMIGREISLEDHLQVVGKRTRLFATLLGLPDSIIDVLAVVGGLHDIGKCDPRFQVWLHDGDEIAAAMAEKLLAKSGKTGRNATAIRRARERAGYPEGGRHECLSAHMVQANPNSIRTERDRELIAYLVGTHHGRGRPFMPVVKEQTAEVVNLKINGEIFRASCDHKLCHLASGWTDLFWAMVRRYGYWNLAYLEAIVRIADWTVSQEEQSER
jgi:CRISPR-associated endonuclease/helicase Cas3